MSIGERIKKRREALGMSADDLAEKLGKNRATVYRYESNYIENLPTTILAPLAKALLTTPAYLMGWEEEEKPAPEGELSDNVKMLVEFARTVPEEKAELVLKLMRAIVEGDL